MLNKLKIDKIKCSFAQVISEGLSYQASKQNKDFYVMRKVIYKIEKIIKKRISSNNYTILEDQIWQDIKNANSNKR